MTYKKLTRNQHFETAGPKRIHALDGGGIRGIVMPLLKELADIDTAGKVDGKHFPAAFDLR